jgi:hypothetical protein
LLVNSVYWKFPFSNAGPNLGECIVARVKIFDIEALIPQLYNHWIVRHAKGHRSLDDGSRLANGDVAWRQKATHAALPPASSATRPAAHDPCDMIRPKIESRVPLFQKLVLLVHRRNTRDCATLMIEYFVSDMWRYPKPCHACYEGPA